MEFDLGKFVMTPRGDYDSSTTYSKLDLVYYQYKTWISKVDNNTNHTPSTSPYYWGLVCEGIAGAQGTNGAQGATGETGSQGATGAQGPAGSGGGGGGGAQGAQGIQGVQGPAGGGSGEFAMKGRPGLLSVQGNVESTMFNFEQNPRPMSVPIWFDTRFKTHVVDVFSMLPVLEAIGFQGTQGIQGIQGPTGSRGVQGYTGADANVIELTQAEYDALEEKDPGTIYIITDAVGPQGAQGASGAPGAQGATGSVDAGADVWTFNLVDGTTVTRRMYYEEVN